MTASYALGLDFGTNSARALLVDCADGREVADAVAVYAHGDQGVVLDPRVPDLARQHPLDYPDAIERCVREALAAAASDPAFDPSRVVGIGVDTTGSTPMPVDAQCRPLATQDRFADDPAALAWLWKDHTAHAEAAEITALAAEQRPRFLAYCGGVYSSEWYWAKLLRCARESPGVFEAAASWLEIADWIPALLAGIDDPSAVKRCRCAAGHKAMFHDDWGGYPDAGFLGALHPLLARHRAGLPERAHTIAEAAGALSPEWSDRLGLPAGIPIAVGAFDAHLGAVGSGIAPGVLVKIMGTSTCDILTVPLGTELPDIPGLCGIVPESVLPGHYGLEAGQSAVGDIFNWFVGRVRPEGHGHESLTAEAEAMRPGASGLLGLDWHNGNRCVLVDQRLTGLMLGQTLATTPAEMYRALVESTAFGARAIVERFEEHGVRVERVVACGGISAKNRMVMQAYADVLGRPMAISRSAQTCALGSAMAASVVAGAHRDFDAAAKAMTGLRPEVFQPDAGASAVYDRLYALYRRLHDSFGGVSQQDLGGVMKELLAIRDEVRAR